MANSYNSVNFSIPTGADPMGIGGFDLGRSSYDPIQSIKEGWATQRQDEIMADENRRKEYEEYMKKLPPAYESVNGKISGELNQKVVEMGRLAYQRYKSGMFAPWAKTESGAKTESELNQMEDYIAKVGPVANKLDSMYKVAYEERNNPDNIDKIDFEETDKNMQEFANAQNIDEMTRAATKPLVVFKPTPVEMNDWFAKYLKVFMPDADKNQTNLTLDTKTGYYVSTTTEKTDPKKLRDAVIKTYTTADDKHKREIERMWKNAPEDEVMIPQTDGSGNIIRDDKKNPVMVRKDIKDWWADTRAPQTAVKITKDFKKDDSGGGFSLNFGGWDKDKGLVDMSKVQKNNYSFVVKENGKETPQTFNSFASIPIQTAFKEPFLEFTSENAVNTKTGEPADQNKAGSYMPLSVEVLPVANQDILLPIEEVPAENPFKTTYLPKLYIKAGERLSKSDLDRIKASKHKANPGSAVSLEPFVLTTSNYKGGMTSGFVSEGITIPGQKEGGKEETIITPYREVIQKMRSHAKANKVDLDELDKYVNAILSNFNGTDILGGPSTNMDANSLLNEILSQ